MPYVAYTKSFGAAYANQQVQVKDSTSGAPVKILAAATGGVISDSGLVALDGSGNLSVFVDSTITPSSVLAFGPGDPAGSASGVLSSAQRAAGATGVAGVTAGGDVLGADGVEIGAPQALSGPYTVTSADDGKMFYCTAPLTITFPAALSPRPSLVVDCPPSGSVTVAVSGGATINGATSSLTRSRSTNPAGFAVIAHQDADDYGVSGS
jgi:hypothetical protein